MLIRGKISSKSSGCMTAWKITFFYLKRMSSLEIAIQMSEIRFQILYYFGKVKIFSSFSKLALVQYATGDYVNFMVYILTGYQWVYRNAASHKVPFWQSFWVFCSCLSLLSQLVCLTIFYGKIGCWWEPYLLEFFWRCPSRLTYGESGHNNSLFF